MKLCFNFYFIDVAILVTACHYNRPTGWRDDAEIIPTVIITHEVIVFSCVRVRLCHCRAIIGGFETGTSNSNAMSLVTGTPF